ncbi:MAG: S49 family peptidase, partial [Chloroflexota bacterium]
AQADPDVSSLLLEVDSPGGTVNGVPELAAEVFAASQRRGGPKPIVAVANGLAASAAYWIASAADEVVVTPSGEVGGVGVFAVHEDWSASYASAGIRHTLISAGKYKVEANSYQPLGEDARQAIQARVNDYYGDFVHALARHRDLSHDTVRTQFGEGRCLGARRAVEAGMADRVATFDETLRRLVRGRANGSTSATPAARTVAGTAGERQPAGGLALPERLTLSRAAWRRLWTQPTHAITIRQPRAPVPATP